MSLQGGVTAFAMTSDVIGIAQKEGSEIGEEIKPYAIETCTFQTRGDNVHISSTPPRTVSAHGYWTNITCPTGTKAVVTTQLQRKNALGIWINVGTVGKKTVYAGGGSANRSVGRYTCNGTDTNTYRSKVDVDIVGWFDTYEKYTSKEVRLSCG